MHFRILVAAAPLAAAIALAAPPATAFEIARAKTEAKLLEDAAGDLVIRLSLSATLLVPPDPIVPPEPVSPDDDVVLGWGGIGGHPPEPGLELRIPAGCFVENRGFHAEGPSCGIVTFDLARMTVDAFEARIVPGDEGRTAHLSMEVEFTDPGDAEHAILAALAGTDLAVAIGGTMAMIMPAEVETLAVPPEPI